MRINKKILSYIICLIPLCANSQKKLVIEGTAPMLNNGTEILIEQILPATSKGPEKKFITKVNKHTFQYVLNVDGPELYHLSVGEHGSDRYFLEPGKLNIKIADSVFGKVFITGNQTGMEYEKYTSNKSQNELDAKYRWANFQYSNYIHGKAVDKNVAQNKLDSLNQLASALEKNGVKNCLEWIRAYPGSSINPKILYDQLLHMPEDSIKKIYATLPASVLNNTWGKELKYVVSHLFIGDKAPDFVQADTSGKKISLSSFKGKYVLIDFWASWCIPCRNENPVLVQINQKYKSRNFAILSISLDEKKESWLNAIKSDGLNWTHLSDLHGLKNTVSANYNITSIPSNYLVDPSGKIIAKNLRGDQLADFLYKLNL